MVHAGTTARIRTRIVFFCSERVNLASAVCRSARTTKVSAALSIYAQAVRCFFVSRSRGRPGRGGLALKTSEDKTYSSDAVLAYGVFFFFRLFIRCTQKRARLGRAGGPSERGAFHLRAGAEVFSPQLVARAGGSERTGAQNVMTKHFA